MKIGEHPGTSAHLQAEVLYQGMAIIILLLLVYYMILSWFQIESFLIICMYVTCIFMAYGYWFELVYWLFSQAVMMRVKNITRQPEGLYSWFIIHVAYTQHATNLGQSAVIAAKCQVPDFRLPVHSPPLHRFAQKLSTTLSTVSSDSPGWRVPGKVQQIWHQPSPVYTWVSKKEREYPETWFIHETDWTYFSFNQPPSPLNQASVSVLFTWVWLFHKCSIQDMVSPLLWPVSAFYTDKSSKCCTPARVNSFSTVVQDVIATRQQIRFHPIWHVSVCVTQAMVVLVLWGQRCELDVRFRASLLSVRRCI